jgi:MFS family permease
VTRSEQTERRELAPLAVVELAVLLGGQAWFVALTWLLIAGGQSGATIGLVLMLGAVPRAVLMLVGGVVTDRYPPVLVLRIATAAMTGLTAIAVLLIAHGPVAVWQLAILAGLFGATDAFFFPAMGGLIPRIVAPERRQRANALIQLCDQLTQVGGPMMAGFLLSGSSEVSTFAVIGSCFALGLVVLFAIRPGHSFGGDQAAVPVTRAIVDGLRFASRTTEVRLCLLVAAALSLATVGPISVGGAMLADQRLGGARALGILLGGFGAGAFVGVMLASIAGAPRSAAATLAIVTSGIGVGVALLGQAQSLAVACALAVPTGVAAGYLGVVATTMVQNRTPPAMQGRMSSVLMFAFFALDPVSQGLTGLLIDLGIGPLFMIAGAVLIGTAGLVALTRRSLS